MLSIIDRKPDIDVYSDEGLKPAKVEGRIEVEAVDFCYPARPDIQVSVVRSCATACGLHTQPYVEMVAPSSLVKMREPLTFVNRTADGCSRCAHDGSIRTHWSWSASSVRTYIKPKGTVTADKRKGNLPCVPCLRRSSGGARRTRRRRVGNICRVDRALVATASRPRS
jgi:hypothetical protein